MRIKWLSVASFEIEDNGHHIVTDPYITANDNSPCTWENVEGCDIITLTHGHFDHITDIPALYEKYNPLIMCGEQTALPLAHWSDCNPMRIYPMTPNLEIDFDWVKVKALFGLHVEANGGCREVETNICNEDIVKKDQGMKELQLIGNIEYRNYLFTFPDGKKVLVWGNEMSVPQRNMLREIKPDAAILQATGQADDPKHYAEFVKEIGAKAVIPHHMDCFLTKDQWMPRMRRIKEELSVTAPETKFIIPEYDQWQSF